MLSKNEQKLILNLADKKNRVKENLFIVEGVKSVNEFLKSDFELFHLYATEAFSHRIEPSKYTIITEIELKKISQQVQPNNVLALFRIPSNQKIEAKGLILALDQIQDPGNLGTIIRLCDWFGIKTLLCSLDTVDCYNPKVVQASMGSLSRISVQYVDLVAFLNSATIPVYLTLLNGQNVYKTTLPKNAILILGNEANGIRKNLIQESFQSLHIPRFGTQQQTESLNVATAAAIFISEFKRRN